MTGDLNTLLARLRAALEDLPCTHQGVLDALLLLEVVEGRAAELAAAGEALVSAWDGGETSGSVAWEEVETAVDLARAAIR